MRLCRPNISSIAPAPSTPRGVNAGLPAPDVSGEASPRSWKAEGDRETARSTCSLQGCSHGRDAEGSVEALQLGAASTPQESLPTLTLGGAGLLAHSLAELVREPQLHADEGLPPLLRQLAPGLRPGQHVAHAALRQAQHLQWARQAGQVSRPLDTALLCGPPEALGARLLSFVLHLQRPAGNPTFLRKLCKTFFWPRVPPPLGSLLVSPTWVLPPSSELCCTAGTH